MANKDIPTPEELRKLLRYDPETGKLFWRERTPDVFKDGKHSAESVCNQWNGRNAGKEAFTTDNGHGYRQGSIFNRLYFAHRVIWAMTHNEWPEYEIDHKQGVRHDNRISELRAVDPSENRKNKKLHKNNTSGYMGVYWYPNSLKWCAQIKVNGRRVHLGYYAQKDDAIAARKAAEVKYGFHPNHGRD